MAKDERFNMNHGPGLAPSSTYVDTAPTTITSTGKSGDSVSQKVVQKYKRINPTQRGR